MHSTHRLVTELLQYADAGDPVSGGSRDRVLAAVRPLLTRAQTTSETRADLSVEQVLDVVLAVPTIRRDADYLDPILQTAPEGRPRRE